MPFGYFTPIYFLNKKEKLIEVDGNISFKNSKKDSELEGRKVLKLNTDTLLVDKKLLIKYWKTTASN